MYNIGHTSIKRHLIKCDVEIRSYSGAQFAYNKKDRPKELDDYEWLYNEYWGLNKTSYEIGEYLNCDYGTVIRSMIKLNIPIKDSSQSKIGVMCGSDHPNWKGGITPLNLLLRGYFHTNLVPKVAERDNFTCQICGKTHTILHVHHIKFFSTIVNEIIQENPQYDVSIEKDKLELYKIITSASRFLGLDNLITLCADCHRAQHSKKTISSQASEGEGSETIENVISE